MNFRKRNLINLIGLIGLVGAVLFLWLMIDHLRPDPPGYCREQKRFLSDEEFIAIAVKYEITSEMMKIDGSEASIRTFHSNHPNCCRVWRGGLKDADIGNDKIVVELLYEVNEKHSKTRGNYYEDNLVMDVCGHFYDSFGMGTTYKRAVQ